MPTIDQFRALIPNGDTLSDYDVVKEVSRTLEMDPRYIADRLGFEANKPGLVSDIKRGAGQVIEALGSTAQDLGLPNVGKSVESYGAGITFKNPSQINTVEEALRSPWTTTREAVGEVVPQVATSVGTGLAGRVIGGALGLPFGPAGVAIGQTLGAGAGAYLGNLAQEYGGIRAEQREQGIDDRGRALATGGAAAVLDTALGAERIANKFLAKGSNILAREAGTSLGKQVAKQTAIGVGIEAGTEGVQTGLERIGAYKDLTSAEAMNEIGLSMIKGGIGGGVIRGGLTAIAGERQPEGGSLLGGTSQQTGSDIQQSFTQPDISATPTTTEAPAATATANIAPVVSGGSTDIAQAQQQANAENQAAEQAQKQQVARENAFSSIGATYNPEGQGSLSIFGQTVLGPQIGTFGNALASKVAALPPQAVQIANAISQANAAFATPEKPSPLVSFTYNGNNPIGSADKVLKALEKVTEKFQIGHVASVDEAASNLNTLSKNAKGAYLEQLNAIHEALTGKDTDGFIASQESKAAKEGAKNGKLQLQTATGVGTVPVEGGTGEANGTNAGAVQPGGVQSVGAGGVAEGSLGLQVGQPSGEGIRAGTGAVPGVVGGELLGPGSGQGQVNEQAQATQSGVGGGQVSGQSEQANQPGVDQKLVQNGPRQYEPRIRYYATDLSHIPGVRRVEIILDLLTTALAPRVQRSNVVPAATRAEILRLALLEQLPHESIAEYTNLNVDTVEKQLERMGVALKAGEFQITDTELAQSLVAVADTYRSPEFPDGIGLEEMTALYSTRYEGEESPTQTLSEEMQTEGVKGDRSAKLLADEMYGGESGEGKSMGEVDSAGGSQGAVDTTGAAQLNAIAAKVAPLQTLLDSLPPKDPRRAAVQKEIDAVWEPYRKEQQKRAKKGEITVTQGEENAVQESSTEEVPVREGAGGGEAVGKGNAKKRKTAGTRKAKAEPKQEAKPEEVKPPEVQTPAEQWNALTVLAPELPAYEVLSRDEKTRWDDLAKRGTANLAAAVRIIGDVAGSTGTALANKGATTEGARGNAPALTDESNVIDVEARVINETIAPKVAALPAPQIDRLEKFYGLKRDTEEFLARVKEDVVTFATKGAEAVSAAIRDVIKTISEGVLAMALVFNPNISASNFAFNLPQTYEQTITVQADVPAEAVAKMSPTAQMVYRNMASVAKKSGKGFIIADKPAGQVHFFNADGSVLVQDTALFGKETGDKLAKSSLLGGPKVTPAGRFTLQVADTEDYAGGKVLRLVESQDATDRTFIAVHAAWLGDPTEKRAERLKSANPADRKISYGCINTSHDTFLKQVLPNIEGFNGGMIFVLPDAVENTADLFAAQKQTITGTQKTAAVTKETSRAQVGKEERGPMASKSKAFYDVGDLADAFDGVAAAQNQLEDMGIEHAMDYVSDWEVINDTSDDAINGEIRTTGGRYTIVLNEAKLTSSKHATETVTHEVGHAVDMAPHGGIYSSQPEMSVSVKDGKITPVGVVAREMFNLYNTRENWREYLEYPFDLTKFPDLNNSTMVEGELFAQVFSAYADPKARAALEELAPGTAAFMAEVIKHVQSTRTLQIQKPETVAVRSLAFRNRNASQRGETGLAPVSGRERESLASRSQALGPEPLTRRLPKPLQSASERITTDLLYQVKKGVLASAITEDVVNMASKYMRSAADYLKAQYARQALRLRHELNVEKVLQQYDKLPKELQGTGKGSVNEFIFDSTTTGLWGYYPGEEFVGTSLLNIDKGMEARFNAFPPAAQKLIKDVFAYGNEALRDKQKAVKDAIDREFSDREKAALGDADELDKIAKDKAKLMKRESRLNNLVNSKPYAYLGRYGDFVMVAKSKEYKHYEELAEQRDPAAIAWIEQNETDPKHYVVEFAETLSEAKAVAERLGATGMYDMPEAFEKEAYADYLSSSDSYVAINRLRKMVAQEFKGGDPDALKSIDKMLGDLYLITAAESSARKSMLQRKDITGADKDMMRNMATSGRANAHFLATLQYNDDIADSINKMRQERKYNNEAATPFFNELLKRHASSMKYETPSTLSSFLTKTTSVWFLATSPAFYLQQMLQTYVLSLPYIAGRLGYFRSARVINAAYKDMSGLVKGISLTDHIDFDKAPADVRGMLQTLVGMGKIDIGVDADAKARAGERNVANRALHKLQSVNTRIESINRATAAIAAYRGYLQRYGKDKTDAATKFAAEVVSNTHGSYDGFNTPRIMQSNAGRVAFQFKRFQIIQLSMLAKLISTAFGKSSKEEKAVARKMLGFITAQMAAIGGVLAVPFVSQAAWILSKVASALGDDEPEDPEVMLRRWIGDQAVADLVLRGATGAAGIESLGKKLGMENVASPFGPYAQIDMTSRAGAEKALVAMMGASAGLSLKMADAFGFMLKGDYYRGLEMAMPNGIGNAMKGYRMLDEGVTRRNKDVVLKPEEISVVDAAFQAVGLPTTTITRQQFTQRVVADQNQYYADKASEIKTNYVSASKDGDTAAMAEARQEWEELQASRRAKGYKVQPLAELFQAVAEARKRERGVVGGVQTTTSNKRFVQEISRI